MIDIEFVSEVQTLDAAWALGVYEEEENPHLPLLAKEILEKKKRQQAVEVFTTENSVLKRYIAVRLGLRSESSKKKREEAGSLLYQKYCEGDEPFLLLDIRGMEPVGIDLLMGLLLSSWRFTKYQSTASKRIGLPKVKVLCFEPRELEKAFMRSRAIIEGVFLARALTSEPPNLCYPAAYAEKLTSLESDGIQVEVLDQTALERIGMSAILSVGRGSSTEPRVVILTWNGLSHSTDPFVVVGKGVTFDSGGLCLKSKDLQQDMKWDKAGAGVVAGLMKSLALQKARLNVIGVVGLVENMPDGNAIRPGDIIKTMSGQTIEIVDTDSEGRLVLADCLWYAQNRFKPKAMVDLGTLTVETIACLANVYAGLYSNSEELSQQLKIAGNQSGDLLWELPMGEAYAKQIESCVADMKNEGNVLCGENGAAAELIRKFVNDVPWAHIDIAGVSWTHENLPLAYKGVTGFGVRLLEEWLQLLEQQRKPLF